jgi:hypothetical protein
MITHAKVPQAKAARGAPEMDSYYYATPMDDGQWELQSSRQTDGPERYAGRIEAMAAASEHCRRQWEVHGTPFGIRVRDRRGEWIDVLLHGGPHPTLAPSLA